MIIVFIVIGLSLLILGHEAGHFFAARRFRMKIDEFGIGFPPRIFARKKGETEYSINAVPFGGFVKIAGENDRIQSGLEKLEALPEEEKQRLFFFQPAWKRSAVILAGVFVNFLIGWLLISFIFAIGTPRALVITEVQAGSPAEAAGVKPGDVILSYGVLGETNAPEDPQESATFIQFVRDHRGEPIVVTLRRGTEKLLLSMTPRTETGPDQGPLGVLLVEGGIEKQGVLGAAWSGLKQSLVILWLTLASFARLLASLLANASLLEGVVGPVGIVAVAYEIGQVGLLNLIQLFAVISLNLTVINLLPFPALDGGRFFMILIEKLKGSPVSRNVEAWANGVGFAFLIVLIGLVTVRDVAGLL